MMDAWRLSQAADDGIEIDAANSSEAQANKRIRMDLTAT
jgi:hypothetical protein